MRKSPRIYSEEEKLSILRDYYSSGMTLYACVRKYELSGNSVLLRWIRSYPSNEKLVSLSSDSETLDMANRSKESYKDENASLKKRIKDLEKALAFSKLETEARDMMISKAEECFNIPIRKKSGAK